MFDETSKAFKRLPTRNKRILGAYGVVIAAIVGTVAWMTLGGGDDEEATTAGPAPIGKSRASGAITPGLAQGEIQVTPQYIEEKRAEEAARLAQTKGEKGSFVPSIRPDLTPADQGAGRLIEPPPPPLPDQGQDDPNSCDTPEGKGILTGAGNCYVVGSGNIYAPDGRVIKDNNGQAIYPDGKIGSSSSAAGTTDGRFSDPKAREDHIKMLADAYKRVVDKENEREKSGGTSSGSGAAVLFPPKKPAQGGTQNGTPAGAPLVVAAAGATSLDGAGKPYRGFLPGRMLIGVIDTEINSDKTTDIRITIPLGPLEGALMTGTIKVQRDSVLAETRYLVWGDKHTSANAVLVDPNTNITALDGEVDNHTLSRLGAAFIYGVTQAARELTLNEGDTTSTTTGSVVTRPSSTNEKILKAGAGYGTEILMDPIKEMATRRPTVRIPRGTMVGIMFREPQPVDWLPDGVFNGEFDL
ncbi:MAG: hypothetical protein CVV05_00735 [Gammaproteobacteria bacterium HGW-Gammaproteobacteria-1]|jgi:hypothetical protein|nr:MAG: hypothetical protein CVV05_00735 [Gammaproteobacteria bacterium HGW-Gammaproteobacteria-1]